MLGSVPTPSNYRKISLGPDEIHLGAVTSQTQTTHSLPPTIHRNEHHPQRHKIATPGWGRQKDNEKTPRLGKDILDPPCRVCGPAFKWPYAGRSFQRPKWSSLGCCCGCQKKLCSARRWDRLILMSILSSCAAHTTRTYRQLTQQKESRLCPTSATQIHESMSESCARMKDGLSLHTM